MRACRAQPRGCRRGAGSRTAYRRSSSGRRRRGREPLCAARRSAVPPRARRCPRDRGGRPPVRGSRRRRSRRAPTTWSGGAPVAGEPGSCVRERTSPAARRPVVRRGRGMVCLPRQVVAESATWWRVPSNLRNVPRCRRLRFWVAGLDLNDPFGTFLRCALSDDSPSALSCPPLSRLSASWPATSGGPGTLRRRTSSSPSTPSCGRRAGRTRSSCSGWSPPTCSPAWPTTPTSWPGSRRPAPTSPTTCGTPLVPGPRRVRPERDRLLLARVRHHRRAAAVQRRPRHPRR